MRRVEDLSGWDRLSLLVCVMLMQLTLSGAANIVPVMLWSTGPSPDLFVNPLHKISGSEFESILAERLGKLQPLLLFVKDDFCVEDFRHKQESLQLLNNGLQLYLPSVESPLTIFENLSFYNITKEDRIESVAEGQLALVQVADLKDVPDIYHDIREKSPNLIVAITGRACVYASSERIKRATDTINDSTPFIINDDLILLYADRSPFFKVDRGEFVPLSMTTYTVQVDKKNYNLTMNFSGVKDYNKITLIAQFDIKNNYFNLAGLNYYPDGEIAKQVTLKSKSEIIFPFNFSYHCFQDHIFSYKSQDNQILLKISNLQVQMDAKKFGEVYDCVGFMSIPIWTGIFVTTILAIIMIWALSMIMDIRTMDRFDDPKSKTITISAQE